MIRIEILEVEIHDIIILMRLAGILKKWRTYLMKDHSNLSKVFSRSILRIMLAFFPFILAKWEMYSWIMMALSAAFLLARKLD